MIAAQDLHRTPSRGQVRQPIGDIFHAVGNEARVPARGYEQRYRLRQDGGDLAIILTGFRVIIVGVDSECGVIVGQALSLSEPHRVVETGDPGRARALLVATSIPAALTSAIQVICTARVTTAHGSRARRVEAESMTSNPAEAMSQGSSPCLRASGRYFTAVYRISSAASRSARQAPGPESCRRISSARSPSELWNPWLAGPAAAAASSLAAGGVCSFTVAPPVREVRHQHPHQDARQRAARPVVCQQSRHVPCAVHGPVRAVWPISNAVSGATDPGTGNQSGTPG